MELSLVNLGVWPEDETGSMSGGAPAGHVQAMDATVSLRRERWLLPASGSEAARAALCTCGALSWRGGGGGTGPRSPQMGGHGTDLRVLGVGGEWDRLRSPRWEGHTAILGWEPPLAREGGWVVGFDPARTGADIVCWPLEHAVHVLTFLRQLQTQALNFPFCMS